MRNMRPGRYVLDAAGVLHPLRRRYHVQAVAIVTVRAIAAKHDTAAQLQAAARDVNMAQSALRVAARNRPDKIDLASAPSSMEQAAASWSGKR